MLETILGGALGGIFRFAPEVLKFLDRGGERKHELAMLGRQIEADRLRAEHGLAIIKAEAEAAASAGELAAIIEATRAQGATTGIGWVDAVSALMRPLLTFWWCIVFYSVALVCQYLALKAGGAATPQAILALWGPEERAIVASIISFWFVDRTLRKGGGVSVAH